MKLAKLVIVYYITGFFQPNTTVVGDCQDIEGWKDSYGYGCNWYDSHADSHACQAYGECCINDDHTANTACCICGGGKNTENVNPSYEPGNLVKKEHGLLLSKGLSSRIIATSGSYVTYADGSHSSTRFHYDPDGGSVFPNPDGSGWVYVSNSEVSNSGGGVGALYFNSDGQVTKYRMLLSGTSRNCGGGKTPWNTWLSCEEVENGHVWEVDPWTGLASKTIVGLLPGEKGDRYESIAYDDRDSRNPSFYLTTDSSRGQIIRFTPNASVVEEAFRKNDFWPILMSPGKMDFLQLIPNIDNGGTFRWVSSLSVGRASARSLFPYSEGIDVRDGLLYFTIKIRKRLFILNLDNGTYQYSSTKSGAFDNQPDQIAHIIGADNSKVGSIIYFCEDGGPKCGIHGRNKEGKYFTILESVEYNTETTGLSFSPDKKHMYVSFQHNPGHIFDVFRDDGMPFDGSSLDIKYHQE